MNLISIITGTIISGIIVFVVSEIVALQTHRMVDFSLVSAANHAAVLAQQTMDDCETIRLSWKDLDPPPVNEPDWSQRGSYPSFPLTDNTFPKNADGTPRTFFARNRFGKKILVESFEPVQLKSATKEAIIYLYSSNPNLKTQKRLLAEDNSYSRKDRPAFKKLIRFYSGGARCPDNTGGTLVSGAGPVYFNSSCNVPKLSDTFPSAKLQSFIIYTDTLLSAPDQSRVGEVSVTIQPGSTDVVLILSAYELTHWSLLGATERVKFVILTGYHYQTISGNNGAPVNVCTQLGPAGEIVNADGRLGYLVPPNTLFTGQGAWIGDAQNPTIYGEYLKSATGLSSLTIQNQYYATDNPLIVN